MLRMILICVTASLAFLAACRSAERESADVVATTTQVADLTSSVAGGAAEVHGILPPGADPHDFEPSPSDASAIAGAELIVTSGGEVDGWVNELIEGSGSDARVVSLLDAVPTTRTLEGETDPHWWHDPRNALAAVETIRDELTRADPSRGSEYADNAAALSRRIEQADRVAAQCLRVLPKAARKLVTAHDSLGYLADRYDLEVVGAAVPALSAQSQPSSGETADLVELIESEGVRAVFPEEGLSSDLEEAIADEAGVAVGESLYTDALGEKGTPGDSYVGAALANVSALVEALSGGSQRCDPLGVA